MMNRNSGFTLIEVIIYVALSALLMGSAFITVYNLIDSTRKTGDKNTTQEEGNFVLRKIDWALTGIDPTTTPAITGSSCQKIISIAKTDTSISPVVIRRDTTNNIIELQKNGGAFTPITTSNVVASCLEFSSTGGTPPGITATVTIDGKLFITTKYIRQ